MRGGRGDSARLEPVISDARCTGRVTTGRAFATGAGMGGTVPFRVVDPGECATERGSVCKWREMKITHNTGTFIKKLIFGVSLACYIKFGWVIHFKTLHSV